MKGFRTGDMYEGQVAIGWQTFKAATRNPVEALRYE